MSARTLVEWLAIPAAIGVLAGLIIASEFRRENTPRKEPPVSCWKDREAQRDVCVGPARMLPFGHGGNLSDPQ